MTESSTQPGPMLSEPRIDCASESICFVADSFAEALSGPMPLLPLG